MIDSENALVVPALSSPAVRTPLPRWTVPVVAVLVLGAAVVASVLLWRWVDGLAFIDADKRSTAHLDVLKLAASIAVGGSGLFALYLAARRQRTQELELEERKRELEQRERVQAHAVDVQAHAVRVAETNRLHAERVAEATERDAVARRVTDLFAKAVEQLGSDKAAVRLGGLYALERLAQDNEPQQSTVVSVLCAYLRMPFEVPSKPPPVGVGPKDEVALGGYRARVQEREVRVAAQRILRDHLRSGDGDALVDTFWRDVDLDLVGATLVDFDLGMCTVRTADLRSATFIGTTAFRRARFTGYGHFGSATFAGDADFTSATFTGYGHFGSATFAGDADFTSATFAGVAAFWSATFAGSAAFRSATFADIAGFGEMTLGGIIRLGEMSVPSLGTFGGTTFTGFADFAHATFTGYGHFGSATFTDDADFTSATFADSADFGRATFVRGVPSGLRVDH